MNESRYRINRFLAAAGLGSRRKCEDLVREGRVRVNGEIADSLSMLIADDDTVTVDGRRVAPDEERVTLVMNKPGGVLSTVSDDFGRRTVADLAGERGWRQRLFPVGRLDMDTTGILLLTDDGVLAYRLTHPKHKVEKRYRVTVEGRVSDETAGKIASGVDLGGYVTRPCAVRVEKRGTDRSVLEVVLKEGRKRQIKRMFAAAGHRVLELERTGYGGLQFPDLGPGDLRRLTREEEDAIRKLTGLL